MYLTKLLSRMKSKWSSDTTMKLARTIQTPMSFLVGLLKLDSRGSHAAGVEAMVPSVDVQTTINVLVLKPPLGGFYCDHHKHTEALH